MADLITITGEGAFDGTVRTQINTNFGTVGILRQATATLTHAQLLVSNDYTLLAAVSGRVIVPVALAAHATITTAYTGGSDIQVGSSDPGNFGPILISVNGNIVKDSPGHFYTMSSLDFIAGTPNISSYGTAAQLAGHTIQASFTGFTGGNAANTLAITLAYFLFNPTTNLFE